MANSEKQLGAPAEDTPDMGKLWLVALGLGCGWAILNTLQGGGGGGNEPKRRSTLGPMVGATWVKINSFNGEPLYEKHRDVGAFPDGWGDPNTLIGRAADGEIIGMMAGTVWQPTSYYPRLIRVYGETPAGLRFNAWVQADQVTLVEPSDWEPNIHYPKAAAVIHSPAVIEAVSTYFNTRYPPDQFYTTP